LEALKVDGGRHHTATCNCDLVAVAVFELLAQNVNLLGRQVAA
jgi:hypothetical protein